MRIHWAERKESHSTCGGRLEDSSEVAAQAAQPSLFVILKTRWCSELSISTEGLMRLRQSPDRPLVWVR